ncbi:YdcF family protein [Pseudomonas sp. 5P_3.1_Bac2]|uniref:YdcF family protein n=1 Tax=Pseudomonas sp. 5P_3.1_Bac2 TaxID=2971617 RepID=UPI0021C99631|nr:YdcF family protein [Pseudomonas sp. 5P_3.1_Bac2]MCU1715612.1 YdcF family protein [Pseudomonas sp. 5P_3.1_Bac2]
MPIRYLFKQLLLPPCGLLLLLLLAWWWRARRPRLARGLFILSFSLLWLFSLPIVVHYAARQIESEPALTPEQWPALAQQAQAIVLLGGGRALADAAWQSDQPSLYAMERLRYAVRVAKASGLPMLISGGKHFGQPPSEAQLMSDVAQRDLAYNVRWQEGDSRTTWENAQFSAAMLKQQGIQRVVLVTQAWHMARARWSFEQAGLQVISAPMGFLSTAVALPDGGWLPDSKALWQNSQLFNEALGLLSYRLLYHAAATDQ